jgi:hypothetical protein
VISVKVAVASSGAGGTAARRGEALLFVPAPVSARWQQLLDDFVDASSDGDAIAAVHETLVDESFALDPFVIVSWGVGRVFVFGDMELTSDMPALPMISGCGSTTWVEHGLGLHTLRPGESCVLRSGVAVGGPSRLSGGIVPADGVAVTVTCGGAAQAAQEPPAAREPAGGDHDAEASTSGWAQLQAAAGDWMEDSVGLPPPPPSAAPTVATPIIEPMVSTTSGPGEQAPPAHRSGPPKRPEFDQEITLDPAPRPTGLRASPSAGPQAVAGAVLLPDGRRLIVSGTLVLGRQPDLTAARVTDSDALACALDVGNEVSRTHLVIRSADGVAEVIDCASSSRTVLLSEGVAEPLALDPWVPYELADGDVLYLGGPTQVRFER